MRAKLVLFAFLVGCAISIVALLREATVDSDASPEHEVQSAEQLAMSRPGSEQRVAAVAEQELPSDQGGTVLNATENSPIPATPAITARVQGAVVRLGGVGCSGLAIMTESSPEIPLAQSGAGGGFEAVVQPDSCLIAGGCGMTTLFRYCVRGTSNTNAMIVVADAIDLAGSVVDPSGAAIAEARIWLEVSARAVGTMIEPLDNSSLLMRHARSGADGRFEFSQLPTGMGLQLQVVAAGFIPIQTAIPLASTDEFVIQLQPVAHQGWRVTGIVLLPTAEPAAGALVSLGEDCSAYTLADGSFVLKVCDDYDGAMLMAVLRGYQPAIYPQFGEELAQNPGQSRDVRLVLGSEALSIEGIVEDDTGEPLPDWRVSLTSGLEATRHKLPPTYVEEIADSDCGNWKTNAVGQFKVGGLMAQDYSLRIWNPITLVHVECGPYPAGTRDLHIRVPADSVFTNLHGRIVAPDGTPISGAKTSIQIGQRCSTGLWTLSRESVYSDEFGCFGFSNVPRRGLMLKCEGESICEIIKAIPDGAEANDIVIEIERKLHFRIRKSSSESWEADMLGVLRADNSSGFLYLPGGYGGPRIPLDGLDNQAIATGESSRFLILIRSGIEVRRIPISFEGDLVSDVTL